MSYKKLDTPRGGTAETAFREAFERLKRGNPDTLPKDSPVTQNNVAKEAKRDPSALRKVRYPSLIHEIQRWIEDFAQKTPRSARNIALSNRKRNRNLREKNSEVVVQRDLALSMLLEADSRILHLSMEIEKLRNSE